MHYHGPFVRTSPSQYSLSQDPVDLLYVLQCVASISDRSLLAIVLSDRLQGPSLHSFLSPLLRKSSFSLSQASSEWSESSEKMCPLFRVSQGFVLMRETQLQPITGYKAYFKEITWLLFDYCTFMDILMYLELLKYLDILYSLIIFTF